MECPKCGKPAERDANFCIYCGAKIEEQKEYGNIEKGNSEINKDIIKEADQNGTKGTMPFLKELYKKTVKSLGNVLMESLYTIKEKNPALIGVSYIALIIIFIFFSCRWVRVYFPQMALDGLYGMGLTGAIRLVVLSGLGYISEQLKTVIGDDDLGELIFSRFIKKELLEKTSRIISSILYILVIVYSVKYEVEIIYSIYTTYKNLGWTWYMLSDTVEPMCGLLLVSVASQIAELLKTYGCVSKIVEIWDKVSEAVFTIIGIIVAANFLFTEFLPGLFKPDRGGFDLLRFLEK